MYLLRSALLSFRNLLTFEHLSLLQGQSWMPQSYRNTRGSSLVNKNLREFSESSKDALLIWLRYLQYTSLGSLNALALLYGAVHHWRSLTALSVSHHSINVASFNYFSLFILLINHKLLLVMRWTKYKCYCNFPYYYIHVT